MVDKEKSESPLTNEALGPTPLNGSYKVSFNLSLSELDGLSVSDVAQALAEGFGDGDILGKVSDLGIEKIVKEGAPVTPVTLKVGDLVGILSDTSIVATILEENGLYRIGASTDASTVIGEASVTIESGSMGYVNKISEDGTTVEVIDLDREVYAPLLDSETDEPLHTFVCVDNISIPIEAVVKLEETFDGN
jgi:hypothetical protein